MTDDKPRWDWIFGWVYLIFALVTVGTGSANGAGWSSWAIGAGFVGLAALSFRRDRRERVGSDRNESSR